MASSANAKKEASKIKTKKHYLIWQLKGHGNLRENTFGDKGRSPDYSTSISVHTVYAFYKDCTLKLTGLEGKQEEWERAFKTWAFREWLQWVRALSLKTF